MKEIGYLGEKLVESWLLNQGYKVLHCNWRCRWGEIDLIAQENSQATLAFVEVKTRGKNNWDQSGMLAITAQKQQKIIKTARVFLAKYPHLAEMSCRFDVALVSYETDRRRFLAHPLTSWKSDQISMGKPIVWQQKYQFILQDYLISAFDLS